MSFYFVPTYFFTITTFTFLFDYLFIFSIIPQNLSILDCLENIFYFYSKHLTEWIVANKNELQQKGLEDYKLATANASINADFSMEDRSQDVSHGMAAMSLEAGEAPAAKPQPAAATNENKKQTAAKEVCVIIVL